jgi:hypothetical protein
MKPTRWIRTAALAATAATFAAGASALEVINTKRGVVIDDASLSVDGRLQVFGHGQIVKDPFRNDGRLYLYLKQARLRFHGHVEAVAYEVQLAFAGEDELRAGLNASLNLLDYSFDVPLARGARLKVGQFKVPYGRERLTDGGRQLFADRSINNLAFRVGRDVGGAVYGRGDALAGALGVFTAGGRDVPERYLPEKLGVPLLSARAGFDNGVDDGLFDLDASIGRVDRVKTAVYANAVYTHDTAIGHNVVLGLKTAEVPLLLNKNWNPYLARAPLDRGTLVQAGGDAVIKAPLGRSTVMASAEGNYAAFSNVYGRIELSGGVAAVGAARGDLELAARYAYLLLDEDMSPGAGKRIARGRTPVQELTPAVTYHLARGRSKVIFDLPILFDAPVAVEKGIGTYVLIPEQPDQTVLVNTVPGSVITRRTVVAGRMIYQLSF